MRYLLILFSLLFSLIFCDIKNIEEIISRHANGNKKLLVVYRGQGKNEEIIERITYSKDDKIIIQEFPLDKIQIFFSYYENNIIKSKNIYKNNKKHGTWIFYDREGLDYKTEYYSNGNFINFNGEWKLSKTFGRMHKNPIGDMIWILDNSNKYISNSTWIFNRQQESLFRCDNFNSNQCHKEVNKSNRFIWKDYSKNFPKDDFNDSSTNNLFGYWEAKDDTLLIYGIENNNSGQNINNPQLNPQDLEILDPIKLIFNYEESNKISMRYYNQRSNLIENNKILLEKIIN